MDKTLKMSFTLSNDKVYNISLKDPKDDLTRTSAVGAMTDAITKEAFVVNGATATAVKDVYVYGTTRIDLT